MGRLGFTGQLGDGADRRGTGGLPQPRPDHALLGRSRAGAGPAPGSSIVIARKVIIVGPGDGLFIYNGTPPAGKLFASIAPAAGTDQFGNPYVGGIAVYDSAGNARIVEAFSANPNLELLNAFGAQIANLSSLKDAQFYYLDTNSAAQGAILMSIAGKAGTDIFGNAYPQGVKIFQGEFDGTNFIINSAGAFFYSGTPAAGNLIASITPTFGTDPFGNAYNSGISSFLTASKLFVEVFGNEIQFGSNAPGSFVSTSGLIVMTDALTATAQPILQFQSPSDGLAAHTALLQLLGASNSGKPPQILIALDSTAGAATTALAEIQGALAALSAAISGSSGTGGLLTVTNAVTATGNPNVQLTGQGATDNMLGIEIAADTNNRWKINASGRMQWGPGNATQDTNLYRGTASVLQTDDALALSNLTAPAALAGAVELYGASGNAGMVNASGLQQSVSGAMLAATAGLTVNGTAFANLATETIPANDGNQVGATYELEVFGNAVWSTSASLTLQVALGSTGIGSITIAAAAFANAASLRWSAKATLVIVTTGAGGTVVGHLQGSMNTTGTALNPGTAGSNTLPFDCGQTTTASFNTTISQALNIQAEWSSTVGTPSITSQAYYLKRVA